MDSSGQNETYACTLHLWSRAAAVSVDGCGPTIGPVVGIHPAGNHEAGGRQGTGHVYCSVVGSAEVAECFGASVDFAYFEKQTTLQICYFSHFVGSWPCG